MKKARTAALVFAAGVIAGCMASGTPTPAQSPAPPVQRSPMGTPFARENDLANSLTAPLIIDRMDLRLGTTVQFRRIPNAGEIHDLTQLLGLAHIVISFPEWPTDFEQLKSLNETPEGSDVVAILPGYAPSRAATEVWTYLRAPLRLVVVVSGAPPNLAAVDDLNSMARLERVIAQMDEPSRAGFERLQRPLSFRKLME